MLVKLKIAMRAFRDLLCAAGAVALGAFFAVERSWIWLAPMLALIVFAAFLLYRIEEWRGARRGRRMGDLRAAHARAKSAMDELAECTAVRRAARQTPRVPLIAKPPKTAKFTWTLTENGVPVGVEYDRRAVDNWMALGEGFDAVAHKLN